jgi:hypothetical protein
MVPVVLFAVGGVLIGGSWSLHGQGASKIAVGLVAVLGLVSLAAGVLWLLPNGTFS